MKPGDYCAAIRTSFPGRANDALRRRLRRIVELDDSWDCAGRAIWAIHRKITLTYAAEAELKKLSELIRSWEMNNNSYVGPDGLKAKQLHPFYTPPQPRS